MWSASWPTWKRTGPAARSSTYTSAAPPPSVRTSPSKDGLLLAMVDSSSPCRVWSHPLSARSPSRGYVVIMPKRVLVAGTGLIGTSIALALRDKGAEVWLSDADPATARLAADLGAGTVVPDLRDAKGIADVAVLAMPPAVVAREIAYAQECAVADAYTDVASVKALPARQARELGCDLESYVPGHPLAGRERHGPAAARADLFLGRTWALCPLPETSPDAVGAVTALAVACGADPVLTDPATHDRWVALVSHAPHLVAVAMAARLAPSAVPADALRLAGQGLRDVTRIAAGDSALWTQILTANAGPVAEVIGAVARDLAAVADDLARPVE